MTKFALLGDRISGNLGVPSILEGLKEVLGRKFPGNKCVVFVPWSSYRDDLDREESLGVELSPLGNYWYLLVIGAVRRLFGFPAGPKKYLRIVDKLRSCDLAIDFNGIIFEESLGRQSFRKCLYRGLRFPLCRVLGVKVVKYTADIGPFRSRWNKFFGKFYMSGCMDLIFARSEVSKRNARELGVKTPIRVLPDTAFVMRYDVDSPPALRTVSGLRRPVIGVSVSFQIHKRLGDRYPREMASFVDDICGTLGVSVILIPNDTFSRPVNDEQVGRMIMESTTSRRCVLMKNDGFSAGDVKSVIANCEALLASRYHSVIAGLSTAVPTLVLGWHHKYMEVLKMFGMEEWQLSVEEFAPELLRKKFGKLWMERERLRGNIQSRLPDIFRAVYSGGDIIAALLRDGRLRESDYAGGLPGRGPED